MDNLIFCLNATVPIFAIILLGRLLRGRNFFSKQTLAEIDKLSFKVLLPILLFRDIAAGRITEQFNAKFFFFCAGVTAVYFFAIWAGAAIFLRDKSMVGAFTQGAFRGSQAILGVAFVQNLYGDAGLVPLMIVASVPLYNIFSVLVLTVTAPDARTADHHGVIRRTLRGIITNPIILGILAGLPFSLLSIDFPPMADKFLSMLGGCATPMALLSIGAGFEGASAIKKLRHFHQAHPAAGRLPADRSAYGLPRAGARRHRHPVRRAEHGFRLCHGEKHGRRPCALVLDHRADDRAERGHADADAVHSEIVCADLTMPLFSGIMGTVMPEKRGFCVLRGGKKGEKAC